MDDVLRGHPRTRGALALCIVAGGMALAWLVGHSAPPCQTDAPRADDRLVLRRRAAQGLEPAIGLRTALSGEQVTASAGPPAMPAEATAALPGDKPDELPPSLAKSFPAVDPSPAAQGGVSPGVAVPAVGLAGQSVRMHKIINGDSLPALAKRYLADENRANEIFEANRDVLSSPDALPIGVELKIPPRDAVTPTAGQSPLPQDLVPIAPRRSRGP